MTRSTTTSAPLRYAPAQRLHQVRSILDSSGGASVYDLAERLGVSVRTAIRYIRALEAAGEPIFEEVEGKRKMWRLMPTARRQTVSLTTSQLVALFLSRRVFDFLAGTGFKEDLEDVFIKLESTLKKKDAISAANLDRKLFDVNEAPHIYRDRIEDVNDIITALLREEQLNITHGSGESGAKTLVLDPYTLLVYKKGLYLAGFSHLHQAIRLFSVDSLREVEWLRGKRFDYPKDYHPKQLVEGAFGLIGGARTHVRIFFEERVAHYLTRREWHPSQRIRTTDGGVVLELEVATTVELESWILGFGSQAEVLEPEHLRNRIAQELFRAAQRYLGPAES